MPDQPTHRIALIGVGDVAQRDYLPELARLTDRVTVEIACGRTDRVVGVAQTYGIPRWTRSFDEAVSDVNVDVVVNLTPFALHVPVTLAAIANGKHVYSEKPLGRSPAEARVIVEAAAASDVHVAAAPSVMVFPQVRRLREILEAGEIGTVHSVHGQAFGGVPPWGGYLSNPSPFFEEDTGPLADMAVYPLHAITGLVGPVRSISALGRRTRDSFTIVDGALSGTTIPIECEDNWHLVMELANGTLATVEANMCVAGTLSPELELRGELGALAIDLLDAAQPVRVLTPSGERKESVEHERATGPDHILGIEHLLDCIDGVAPPKLTIAHAVHVLDVLEAARQSFRDRRVIDVRPGDFAEQEASRRG